MDPGDDDDGEGACDGDSADDGDGNGDSDGEDKIFYLG